MFQYLLSQFCCFSNHEGLYSFRIFYINFTNLTTESLPDHPKRLHFVISSSSFTTTTTTIATSSTTTYYYHLITDYKLTNQFFLIGSDKEIVSQILRYWCLLKWRSLHYNKIIDKCCQKYIQIKTNLVTQYSHYTTTVSSAQRNNTIIFCLKYCYYSWLSFLYAG